MDPNAALDNLREAVARYNEAYDNGDPEGCRYAAHDLAEAADALDGWITRGGFLPTGWQRKGTS